MIKTLRETEDVILYSNVLSISEEDKEKVVEFLETEYQNETLNYPFVVPVFDCKSALASAELIYMVAQFILYRKNEESELEQLLPKLDFEVNAETILSIDLCLRFLPDMITSLKAIDSEDVLLPYLEQILCIWHYSGVKDIKEVESIDLQPILKNDCMKQLFLDRIVECKQKKLAQVPEINTLLTSQMGMYVEDYWPGFKLISENE